MQQAAQQPQQPLSALPPLVFHNTPNTQADNFTPTSMQPGLYSQPSNESLREAVGNTSSSDGEGSGFTPKQYRTTSSFNAVSRPHQLSISNGSGPPGFVPSSESFGPNQGYQTPTHQDIFGTRAPPSNRQFDFDIGPNVPGPASGFMPQNGPPYQPMGQLPHQPAPIGKPPTAAHMAQPMNSSHLIQPPANSGPRGSMNSIHGGPNGATAGPLPSSNQFAGPANHQAAIQQAVSSLGLQYGTPAFNDLVSKLSRQEGSGFQPNSVPQEEISTIFVVGFPDDMSEREFQNMFTFSSGFEAATLKIPNKEPGYGASSNGQGLTSANALRSGAFPANGFVTGGPNDPYNLVTVNSGGVVLDPPAPSAPGQWPNDDPYAIRTLPLTGAPPAPGNELNHLTMPAPPRKQIIGFAKFRTRQEALEARDVLQGRRVDAEKGAFLKAEMAKKNLHTKRGVGPLGLPLNQALPSNNNNNNPPHPSQDSASGMSGFTGNSLLGGNAGLGEQLSQRDRDLAAIDAMGLGNGLWDKERERELRNNNTNAFDAFHSVPSSTASTTSRLPPPLSTTGLSNGMVGNGILSPTEFVPRSHVMGFSTSPMNGHASLMGAGSGGGPLPPPGLNPTSALSPPMTPNQWLPPLASNSDPINSETNNIGPIARPSSSVALSTPPGSTSSSGRSPERGVPLPPSDASTGSNEDIHGLHDDSDQEREREYSQDELAGTMGRMSLKVTTQVGSTSPQLPSPGSGSGSGTDKRQSASDQNPPINTLYVGNLPTASGQTHSPSYLEEALRNLFSRTPGYRKLCFRQKSNGPMCFVEASEPNLDLQFEDVNYATKALNEMYGNTLGGLVKGGIRLSFSKNPLGVRTPSLSSPVGGAPPPSTFSAALAGISERGSFNSGRQLASPTGTYEPHSIGSRLMRQDSAELLSPTGMLSPTGTSMTFPGSPPSRFFSPPLPPPGQGTFSPVIAPSNSLPPFNRAPQSQTFGSGQSSGYGSQPQSFSSVGSFSHSHWSTAPAPQPFSLAQTGLNEGSEPYDAREREREREQSGHSPYSLSASPGAGHIAQELASRSH